MNIEQKMLSSMAGSRKAKLRIFYMQERLEVISAQMRLALEHRVFSMPRSWETHDSKTTHETHQSKARTMNTPFFIDVFECMPEQMMSPVDRPETRHILRGFGIQCFVGMFQIDADKTSTLLDANAAVTYPAHIDLLDYLRNYHQY